MTEWFYKTTPTKVSLAETRDLAVKDPFICRSAFEANRSRADNTQHVEFRDIIHVYFTGEGEPAVTGPSRSSVRSGIPFENGSSRG